MAVTVSTHSLTQVSQDIANNQSIVRYLVKITTSGQSHNDNNITTTYYIDGVRYTKTHKLLANTTTTVVDKSVTLTHNNDGTRSTSASFSTPTQISAGTITGSKSLTLDTIPRASQITVNDANIGSSTNIVINKASDGFTTTLWYKTIGDNDWIQIVDKTPNQVYGWTVPTSFYQKIPANQTLYCEFKADTYNGNTYVGTSSIAGATFRATGVPVINSVTLIDENSTTVALTGNNTKMIRYASQVKVTVNASAQNSAWISSIFVNNQQANNNGEVVFYYADTNNFQVAVNDSRGYPSYHIATMDMVDYVPLTLNADIRRNQPTDGKININFSGNYFNGGFGSQNNTLTVQYRYQEVGGSWSNWTNVTATPSGNSYSGSTQLSDMDYSKSFNFEMQAYDKLFTRSITGITVTKGTPVYWWDNDQFDTNVRTNVNNDLGVTGAILANNGVNFLYGHDKYIYWKEGEYGDKFGISPDFNGADNDNKLRIRGAVGDYGTDPNMYDLATISGKDGNGWLKGSLKVDNGMYSADVGQVQNQNVTGTILIKKADVTSDATPNNGVVLEYSAFQGWGGQLYIGDNADQGVYYNGWSNGIRGSWKRLCPEESTTGTDASPFDSISTGSFVSMSWAKLGKVMTINLRLKPNTSTSAGNNAFVGIIKSVYRPLVEVNGASYNGERGMVSNLQTDGTFTVRVVSGTLSSNAEFGIGFTYVI